jgi:hypothetical protein
MAQPTPAEANGASTPVNDEIEHVAIPGKRKRDSEDDEGADEMTGVEEQKPTAPHRWAAGEQKDLIKSYFDVLKRYVAPFSWFAPPWQFSAVLPPLRSSPL